MKYGQRHHLFKMNQPDLTLKRKRPWEKKDEENERNKQEKGRSKERPLPRDQMIRLKPYLQVLEPLLPLHLLEQQSVLEEQGVPAVPQPPPPPQVTPTTANASVTSVAL